MKKERKFDGVLFDIDGTVLNTGEYIYEAYRHTMALYFRREITWEDVVPVLGLPFEQCYRLLTNLEEVDYLMECHQQYQTRNTQLAKPYGNTLRTLGALKKAGVAMSAVTSHTGELLIRNLKNAGIDEFFQAIVTPFEVINPKPHPESIFKALEAMKLKPNRAVFIGDSPADMEAGQAAGVKTIAALYGFHGQKLLKFKPDYAVEDIKDIVPIIFGSR